MLAGANSAGHTGGMTLLLSVPRELAAKIRQKKNQIALDGSLNLHLVCPRNKCEMPSQHSPDKEPFSLQIPRTLLRRIQRQAKALGMTVPGFIIAVLTEKTAHITLTSKDYAAITEATKKAEETGRRCATRFDDPA